MRRDIVICPYLPIGNPRLTPLPSILTSVCEERVTRGVPSAYLRSYVRSLACSRVEDWSLVYYLIFHCRIGTNFPGYNWIYCLRDLRYILICFHTTRINTMCKKNKTKKPNTFSLLVFKVLGQRSRSLEVNSENYCEQDLNYSSRPVFVRRLGKKHTDSTSYWI